jgi:DNA-binding NarL/FixJ family response regulator
MSEKTVGIVIADDHPVVRMGVRLVLESEEGVHVLGEAGDGRESLEKVEQLRPDVLLLDLSMPQLTGIEVLAELRARKSSTRTILLTASAEKKQILDALRLGARGILMKGALPSELGSCIRTVLSGGYWAFGTVVPDLVVLLEQLMRESAPAPRNTFGLTPRELQVTALVAEGLTNKDVAAEYKISEETVKHHIKRIFDKTGVSNRLELAIFAMNHRLVQQP